MDCHIWMGEIDWEVVRLVDVKEIQRLLDDLETKADDKEQMAEGLFRVGNDNDGNYQEGYSDGLEYAAAILRQVL